MHALLHTKAIYGILLVRERAQSMCARMAREATMVIAIFGENCTGKSTLADALRQALSAAVYTGKDYLRLAKSEEEAKKAFMQMLLSAEGHVIYVVSEREHLQLLPAGCLRVLVTAELSVIQERFSKRTGGVLPPPVAAMLAKKHGMFDAEPHDIRMASGQDTAQAVCEDICRRLA